MIETCLLHGHRCQKHSWIHPACSFEPFYILSSTEYWKYKIRLAIYVARRRLPVQRRVFHDRLQSSEALSAAKENPSPFSAMNVIFAGDFAQLPPVGYTRLYSSITSASSKNKDRRTAGKKDVIGKVLWLSICCDFERSMV